MRIKFEVGKYYRTVNGKKVRVVATDGVFPETIIGIIQGEFNGEWKSDGIHEWIDKPSPPWAEVPKWFNWFAMDENGKQFYYEGRPINQGSSWIFRSGAFLNIHNDHRIPVTCDWKDSLVERPTT